MIDAADLSDEALEALEADNARRWEALAEHVELEALEHPVLYAGGPDAYAVARQLRDLEGRLEAAERVCELADLFDFRTAKSNQPTVDALYRALDAWRRVRGES